MGDIRKTQKEGVSGRVEGARKLPRDSRGTPSNSSKFKSNSGGVNVKAFFGVF